MNTDTFILIVLFYLFYALVSFAFVYANDIIIDVDIDFKTYTPSINDLSEEERTSVYEINNYIENTICPRYHHQILKKEIHYYQGNWFLGNVISFMCSILLSFIPLKIFGFDLNVWWWFFPYVVSLIMSCICYIVVSEIYHKQKHSSIRIEQYDEFHSSYDWESHYDYLLLRKKTVIYRYSLRNTLAVLAFVCFFIAAVIYKGI